MSVALPELFRAAPVQTSLLAGGPLVLAVVQLANSYVNGLSPVIAVAFAAVMVAFAVVATGHCAARYRLERLQRDLDVEGSVGTGAGRFAD